MAYVDPKSVVSPKSRWKLIEILRNGEDSKNGDNDATLAIGEWDGERCFAVRWNGTAMDPTGVGNPQSRGLPTWFIVPCWMNQSLLDGNIIPEGKKVLVAALLA